MVTVNRDRIYSEEDPLPITAGKGQSTKRTVAVSSEELGGILDVLERIVDQLALVTGVHLAQGERFR